MHTVSSIKFAIAISILLFPALIHSAALWDIFGTGDKNRGPRPEDGECSHWDRTNAYFATYDADDLIAFHRTFPIGSYVKVLNEETKKSVTVRIVASGPLVDGRVMELSPAAFSQVSSLGEVVFDCKVYPPAGNRPGPEGGEYSGTQGSQIGGYGSEGSQTGGYGSQGSQEGYGTYPGSGGHHAAAGSGYQGSSNPGGDDSYGYPGMGSGGGGQASLGGGYEALDSSPGTLNPGFGPPPVLPGSQGQQGNPLHKQNWRSVRDGSRTC